MSMDSTFEGFSRDLDFGYVNKRTDAPKKHHPELVLNNETNSMLRALRFEMRRASSFTFSVAFVSPRAIALLKQELIDFEGVGRIITSDYLGFNSPAAFAELLNLQSLGLDVRISAREAFHPKGYVFTQPDGVTAILGSSNLTEGALARNHEWNLRVSASRESDLAAQFTNLLDEELFSSEPLTQSWIDRYSTGYQPPADRTSKRASRDQNGIDQTPNNEITPNAMQIDALSAIASVREANKNRALVISATGTGKTILSAFDVQTVNPQKMLFIAHREQILDRSIAAFKNVLGAPATDFGKVVGSKRELDKRYVFATVQTLSQEHVLEAIDPETFDYILIDEVHRAGASSFQKVIDHFKPHFLLGMTATPERTDGQNVFEIFDYNVPYEIRLNSALELGMLTPFHYYGVADLTFDDGTTTSDATSLRKLVAPERVEHIVKTIEIYGQAGVDPRGLIFCSRNDEARELSEELNKLKLRGKQLRTVALTGQDSVEERERVVGLLESGEIDYILSVDIFNEGVDIPTLNQVIMLRQTQSSIIFVQQLGRGLRKVKGKEFLVVIDFIGNYANNFLIPIALFGDDSLNKESLRKNLIAAEEAGVLSGLSSVSFDKIAQKRVLQSLTAVKLDSLQNLKTAIEVVRNRVGRTPLLADFMKYESVDPVVLATREGNYPALLEKLKITPSQYSIEESNFLTCISQEMFASKRPHELLLLRFLLINGSLNFDTALIELASVGLSADEHQFKTIMKSLTLEFNTEPEIKALGGISPVQKLPDGTYSLSESLATSYQSNDSFHVQVDDLIQTGLNLIADRYRIDQPFTVGKQYSRKDASRLLNWRSNMSSTIYGYKVDDETRTCPVFVTLHKSDGVSASTAYEDELLDPQTLQWFTRSKRNLQSKEVDSIVNNKVKIHVFAKQSDADGPGHYYLGQARAEEAFETTMPDKDEKALSVVRMYLKFENPIQTGLFDYFHSVLSS